jgi:trehalose utilization protein
VNQNHLNLIELQRQCARLMVWLVWHVTHLSSDLDGMTNCKLTMRESNTSQRMWTVALARRRARVTWPSKTLIV